MIKELTNSTRNLLKNCGCKSGCPSCIYSPKCGNDNKPLHKKATEFILDYMWEEMNKISPEELARLENEEFNKEDADYDNLNNSSKEKNNSAESDNDTEENNEDSKEDIIKEEYDRALEEYEKENYSISKDILTDIIINYDNQNADVYYLIGKILSKQGDNQGALSFIKKAMTIEPGHELANEFYFELKK